MAEAMAAGCENCLGSVSTSRVSVLVCILMVAFGCGQPTADQANGQAGKEQEDHWGPLHNEDHGLAGPSSRPPSVAYAQLLVDRRRTTETLTELGNAFLHEGSAENAVNTFKECLEIDASHQWCQLGMAQALCLSSRYREAAAAYGQAATLARTDLGQTMMIYHAGVAAWKAGDLDLAERYYKEVLDGLTLDGEALDGVSEVDRENAEHYATLVWMLLGRVYGETGRYAESVQAFEKASESKSPKIRSVAALWGALASLEVGDWPAALEKRSRIYIEHLSDDEISFLREVIDPMLEELR